MDIDFGYRIIHKEYRPITWRCGGFTEEAWVNVDLRTFRDCNAIFWKF